MTVQERRRRRLKEAENRITMLRNEQGPNGHKHDAAIAGIQRYVDLLRPLLSEVEKQDAE